MLGHRNTAELSSSGLTRLAFFLSVIVATIALAGCSSGNKSNKDGVSGKITINNAPVSGEVVFVCSDGKEYKGLIGLDGVYMVPSPAKGDAKIYVKTMTASIGAGAPTGAGAAKSDMPAAAGAGTPPPAKYTKAETSGLTYTVKGGEEKFDITLTP